MIWALAIGGGILAVVIVMAVWGATLPKDHRATCSVELKQSQDTLWRAITDVDAMTEWRTDVKRIERTDDDGSSWIEHSKSGRIPVEIVEQDAPARLVTRINDDTLPFGGTWTYELTQTDNGCRVVITEDGEVYNVLFRFMTRYVFSHDATMRRYLRNLAAKFDETAVISKSS